MSRSLKWNELFSPFPVDFSGFFIAQDHSNEWSYPLLTDDGNDENDDDKVDDFMILTPYDMYKGDWSVIDLDLNIKCPAGYTVL